MASTTEKKRFSLLVGVETYFNDKSSNSRKFENGEFVSLRNLQGVGNDIETMRGLLQNQFDFEEPIILSSFPSAAANSRSPQESVDRWPTHANIKKQLHQICKESKKGDIFLFYFAGHGATLPTLGKSPKDGRKKDPSLMTADYCNGYPAVRGWELNNWLKQFGDKEVRVIVIIDSCYSAGAWRNSDQWRTPFDWSEPPNLPSDEIAVQGTQGKPGHRDGEVETVWDLDLRDMTVMTACKATETASEQMEDGSTYGAFTLALKKCLPPLAPTSSYRTLRDSTTKMLLSWNLPQNPQVFGQDRLAFLQDFEPVMATPVLGTMNNGLVSLDAGKIHGINRDTEFVSTSASAVKVEITEVDDYTSTARILSGSIQNPEQPLKLVPSRWSMAETLKVTVDQNLGQAFKTFLTSELEKRIVGRFSCSVESTVLNDENTQTIHLDLAKKEDNNINIFGQKWLTKNEGPVHGWKLEGRTVEEKAKESAIAIRHLFRFGQIRQLQSETKDTAPFNVSISQVDKKPRQFQHTFQNLKGEELYVVVFILSAGFHVKQLHPGADTTNPISGKDVKSFQFCLRAPDKSKTKETDKQEQRYHDTVRTIVMRGKSVSMKCIELPDIWNAGEWETRDVKTDRDGDVVEQFDWWFQDDVLAYTA